MRSCLRKFFEPFRRLQITSFPLATKASTIARYRFTTRDDRPGRACRRLWLLSPGIAKGLMCACTPSRPSPAVCFYYLFLTLRYSSFFAGMASSDIGRRVSNGAKPSLLKSFFTCPSGLLTSRPSDVVSCTCLLVPSPFFLLPNLTLAFLRIATAHRM